MEDRFASLDGVVDVVSGYMGGQQQNPTYEEVCSGETGHAEVVEVTYQPQLVSYQELVAQFFAMHDPTTPDRQGPNRGSQYRSVIFCCDAVQMKIVDLEIQRLQDQEAHEGRPVVTEVTSPAPTFWRAEEYHQDYYKKHRGFCSR